MLARLSKLFPRHPVRRERPHTPPADEPSAALNPDRVAYLGPTPPRAIPPRASPAPTPAQPPAALQSSRRQLPWRTLALAGYAALMVLAALLAYAALRPRQRPMTEREVQQVVAQAMASATPAPNTAARVYELIKPSIVLVSAHSAESEEATEEEEAGNGIGSGVVLDEAGHILTCLHVVEGASEIAVIFADGASVEAVIESRMPEKDIAVLRVLERPPLLVPATLGNPEMLSVGEEAIVVGNPFGLRHTVTSGVISGLHRNLRASSTGQALEDLIQFDTAVNPGNSGGALLNRDGEVVGIVTALANPTGQKVFIGLGFAVPIDVAASAAGAPPF